MTRLESPLLANAIDSLGNWQPLTQRQEQLRGDFVHHLVQHHDGWSRGCRPDHLTASAIVLDHTRERVLLALHRKVGLWLQFGGHIEPTDVSVLAAARREAIEESGIEELTMVSDQPLQLDRHAAPCDQAARFHLDVQYLALTDAAQRPVTSAESLHVQWFSVTELPEQTDEAVQSLVAAATR
jgi:8-oxo-dGTP pyrophosphatase MutT (NUDIX family)